MITPTDLDLPAHLAAEGWQLHQPQPSWPDLRTPDQRLAAELDDLRRRVAALEAVLYRGDVAVAPTEG